MKTLFLPGAICLISLWSDMSGNSLDQIWITPHYTVCINQSRFPRIKKLWVNCFVHRYCFFQELSHFLKISVGDPWKILWVSQNSILETRFSILENWNSRPEPWNSILKNFEDRESSFELRLSTYLWVVLYLISKKPTLLNSCSVFRISQWRVQIKAHWG